MTTLHLTNHLDKKTRTQFPLNRHWGMQDIRLMWDHSTSYGWGKSTVSNIAGKVTPGRKEKQATAICFVVLQWPMNSSKLNGRTENKSVITKPKLLSFTLDKCRLLIWLLTQIKQRGAYRPLQKTRRILLSNRGLQTKLILLWHMEDFHGIIYNLLFLIWE